MSLLKILSKQEIENFDKLPKLTEFQKRKYFAINNNEVDRNIDKIKNNTNKVGFILVYGYLLFAGKFINPRNFNKEDIEYVVDLLGIDIDTVDLSKYIDNGFFRHKRIIAKITGIKLFNDFDKNIFIKEVDSLIINQIRPRQIFLMILKFLQSKKIEIPHYIPKRFC